MNKHLEEFNENCKVLDLAREYHEYDGTERYAIITELTKEELLERYGDIVEPYMPFVLLSLQHGEVIDDFNRNNEKFKKRQQLYGEYFSFEDGTTEQFHNEVSDNSFAENFIESMTVQDALKNLPAIQRNRIFKHFYLGYSARAIAKQEGTSHSAVNKSIALGLEKLRKFLI